jgi:Tetratricopeptide repeat
VNQQSEHLSNAQIESYGDRSSGAGPEQDQQVEVEQVETHLADCPSCRTRLLDFQRAHLDLLADRTPAGTNLSADIRVNAASTPACPSEDDLRELAAGLSPEAVAFSLIQHAATCDHCGPLLRTYTEDFSDDSNAEEQAVLDQLKSASAKWQKQTARRMLDPAAVAATGAPAGCTTGVPTEAAAGAAGASSDEAFGASPASSSASKPSSKTARKLFFWKWALVPATAAATATALAVICGAVGLGVWYVRRDTPEKVEKLLAQAYTGQRTMEWRWPGADYAPTHITQGSASVLSKPTQFLTALDIITRKLADQPDNPSWIRAKAEADILQWQPDSAIEVLNKALMVNPNSTVLKLDLAIAYAQSAQISGDIGTYEKAQTVLAEILAQTPSDPAALYNRALVAERIGEPKVAAAHWQAVIAAEPESGWAAEARNHMAALQHSDK